jgi:hypothetical protein
MDHVLQTGQGRVAWIQDSKVREGLGHGYRIPRSGRDWGMDTGFQGQGGTGAWIQDSKDREGLGHGYRIPRTGRDWGMFRAWRGITQYNYIFLIPVPIACT